MLKIFANAHIFQLFAVFVRSFLLKCVVIPRLLRATSSAKIYVVIFLTWAGNIRIEIKESHLEEKTKASNNQHARQFHRNCWCISHFLQMYAILPTKPCREEIWSNALTHKANLTIALAPKCKISPAEVN